MTEPTLTHVSRLVTALQETISSARGSGRQGRATLIDLHNQTREIAAVLNEALGGRSEVRNDHYTAGFTPNSRYCPRWRI